MARINGVDLPRQINVDTRVKDLTEDEVNAIREYIDKNAIMVEGDLRRESTQDDKRLLDIGCHPEKRRRV